MRCYGAVHNGVLYFVELGLQENIDVGYSFWISERLSEKQKSLSASEN